MGTRLGDAAAGKPKCLADINGRPFIFYVLERLCKAGITEIVICTGHKSEQFEELLGDGRRFGQKIVYSDDGPSPLGTGGAVRKALPLLGRYFMVQYGDTLLNLDYASMWDSFREAGKPVMMSVYRNNNRLDSSNVVFEHGQVKEYNKNNRHIRMTYIDYGAMVFSADIFDRYPANMNFDLADLLSQLASDGQIAGIEVHEAFYEIGNPASLERARNWLSQNGT